jgi:hypothetical protein
MLWVRLTRMEKNRAKNAPIFKRRVTRQLQFEPLIIHIGALITLEDTNSPARSDNRIGLFKTTTCPDKSDRDNPRMATPEIN